MLFIRRNIQIAVVEAKADYANVADGLAQAMRYAEMLGVKFAYASNGKKIIEHDFITGLERDLSEFPTPDELWGRLQGTLNLPRPEDQADALSAYREQVGGKTPRYYQMIAINRVVNAVLGGQKRIDGHRHRQNLCRFLDCLAAGGVPEWAAGAGLRTAGGAG